jgi:CBS domain-containing protein
MRVADIMTKAAVTDSPSDTLAEAASKMWREKTGSLLVMEDGELKGIVTERDLLRVVGEGKDPKSVTVADAMTHDPVTVPPDTALIAAAYIMFEKWFRHLPVVTGEGDLVGVISLRDLLNLVARGMEEPEKLTVLTGHKLVRDRRLELIEAGDLD